MKIYHLDCTLRDGGYYNNWNFSKKFVEDYLNIVSSIDLDCIEIGFRFIKNDFSLGNCAYTTENFLNSLDTKNIKVPLAIMLNASEFVNINKNKLIKICNNLFVKKSKSKISIIRIACRLNEIEKLGALILILKKKGYKIIINLMQISLLNTSQIKKSSYQVSKFGVKILYIADSIGSLNPKEVKRIIQTIKKNFTGQVGVHMHDNMKLALSNTVQAKEIGATWLDSTINGMGRGAGNTCTEDLIYFINKKRKNLNINKFEKYIEENFSELKKKYNWGSNIFYKLSALYNIHPTYIQELLKDKRYSKEEKLNIIEFLRVNRSETYSKKLLTFPRKIKNIHNFRKSTDIKHSIKKKEFLIFGAGLSISKHKKKILQYIKNNKPYVISVNYNKFISEKYINNYAVLNLERFVIDFKYYLNCNKKIILPRSIMENHFGHKRLTSLKIYNYDTIIKKNKFNVFENYSEIPNSLTATYALSFAISRKPVKITFAGFDGYENKNILNKEINNILNLLKKNFKLIKISSITPSIYKFN